MPLVTAAILRIVSLIGLVVLATPCVWGCGVWYQLRGRVVDDDLKPVVGASLRLRSRVLGESDLVDIYDTDANGRFVIDLRPCRKVNDWKFFAVDSKLPADTNELLSIGNALNTDYYPAYAGSRIQAKPNMPTELGDVRLQYTLYPVLVKILDTEGRPLIKQRNLLDDGFDPKWMLRDPIGNVLSEGGNSFSDFRFAESAVMIGLPKGNWQVDISDWNDSGLETTLNVLVPGKEATSVVTAQLHPVHYKFEGKRKTTGTNLTIYRKELRRLGYTFDSKTFNKVIENGNDKLVKLFLDGGMIPDSPDGSGKRVEDAIWHPRVLKLILEAGARVDRRVIYGLTPLLGACGTSVISLDSIKMLLEAGADPYLKDENGRDAFSLAEGRDDVLKLLEKYRKRGNSKHQKYGF